MVHPYLRRREGKEKVEYPPPELRRGARKDARRAAVPGTGDEGRHRRRRLHAGRGRPAAPRRWRRSSSPAGSAISSDKLIEGMVERGYDRGFRRAHLQADRGLRQLRLPRKPRGQLRHDRLRLVLDEMPPSRRLLRGAAQRPADGLLRAGPDRPRRPGAWRGGPAGLHQREPWDCTLEGARAAASCIAPLRAAGLRDGERPRPTSHAAPDPRRARRSALRLGRGRLAPLRRAGRRRWRSSPMPTPSPRSGSTAAQALWQVRGLGEAPLPLFAAADASAAGSEPESR